MLDFDKNFDTNQYEIIELNINGYKFLDRNGNKQLDIYEDDRKPIELRVSDLLSKLTKEEKVRMLKGSGMSSGIGMSPEANLLQELAFQSPLKIPILIGIDAIHGNALVSGTTVYPSPITLASTWSDSFLYDVGKQSAKEMRATGSHWAFTPNIDVLRDPRWGRVGETFGEDPYMVGNMGAAMINGFQQGDFSGPEKVIACQ